MKDILIPIIAFIIGLFISDIITRYEKRKNKILVLRRDTNEDDYSIKVDNINVNIDDGIILHANKDYDIDPGSSYIINTETYIELPDNVYCTFTPSGSLLSNHQLVINMFDKQNSCGYKGNINLSVYKGVVIKPCKLTDGRDFINFGSFPRENCNIKSGQVLGYLRFHKIHKFDIVK